MWLGTRAVNIPQRDTRFLQKTGPGVCVFLSQSDQLQPVDLKHQKKEEGERDTQTVYTLGASERDFCWTQPWS